MGKKSEQGQVLIRVLGSPTAEAIKENATSIIDLLGDAGLGSIKISGARLRCDECGVPSRGLDYAQLDQEIRKLVSEGWTRGAFDRCPECSQGNQGSP